MAIFGVSCAILAIFGVYPIIYSRHYKSMSYGNCCPNVTRHKLSVICSNGNVTSNNSVFVIIRPQNV
jgi:hypothetical protein